MGLEFSWEPMVYRNKLGRIIEADELEILLRYNEYRIIKQDEVGPYLISTVWLGVPVGEAYFETMVFEGDDSVEFFRYCTIKEAEEGHEKILNEWRENVRANEQSKRNLN